MINTFMKNDEKMKCSEFVTRLKNIATNYKTLYVMECYGAPLTKENKQKYTKNHHFNGSPERQKKIEEASEDTFGFDCISLIKCVLWGWSGDKNHPCGGATYGINGVPDIDSAEMIRECSGSSSDFQTIVPGEIVWLEGHIGVYIGDGLVVECSPSFKDKVQFTALENIGKKTGYDGRHWAKHAKLPYIEY